jgi:hypothetical protein
MLLFLLLFVIGVLAVPLAIDISVYGWENNIFSRIVEEFRTYFKKG